MWNRVPSMMNSKFARDESGALLVFFAMCVSAIFLIVALSFDLGRRASTQTELQSFVDNVALAAAGELDGKAGSRARARAAAANLIEDSFVFGTETDKELGRQLKGATDFNLAFYSSLPSDDQAALTNRILDSNTTGDLIARFVHISLYEDALPDGEDRRVTVPWVFGRLLLLFGSSLPDEEVGAEAVAGFTSLGCGQAPIFFCMPQTGPGPISDWDPANHIGENILFRTQGGSNKWSPGNFSWLDVISMVGDQAKVDTGSPCFGLSGSTLYNCLIAADGLLTYCIESGTVDLLPGNKDGIAPAGFNTRFDMFNATVQQDANTSIFKPAPIVTKPYQTDTTCPSTAEQTANDTTDFLPDDCFASGTIEGNGCLNYDSEIRYGDGDWSMARLKYVDINYAMDTSFGNVNMNDAADLLAPGDIMTIDGQDYHKADPFRPEGDTELAYTDAKYRKENTVNPALKPTHGWDKLPVVLQTPAADTGTRWEYYQAEVATAYYDNPKAAYNSGDFNLKATKRSAELDLIQGFEVDGGPDYTRTGTSLPHCSAPVAPSPERRLITAAVIDCEAQKGNMNGKAEDVIVSYWVEVFLTSVFGGTTTPGSKDIYGELVSANSTGLSSAGSFRDMIQLYR